MKQQLSKILKLEIKFNFQSKLQNLYWEIQKNKDMNQELIKNSVNSFNFWNTRKMSLFENI